MTGNKYIRNAPTFQICTNTCVKACRFIFCNPNPQDFFLPFQINPQYTVYALLNYPVVFSGIEYNPVEENDWINAFQRPVLPFIYVRKHFICNLRNHTLRYIGSINFPDRFFNISLAHPLGIHR